MSAGMLQDVRLAREAMQQTECATLSVISSLAACGCTPLCCTTLTLIMAKKRLNDQEILNILFDDDGSDDLNDIITDEIIATNSYNTAREQRHCSA